MTLFYDHMVTWGGEIEWYWILAIATGGAALIFGLIACICTSRYFGRGQKKDEEEARHIVNEKAKKINLNTRKSIIPKEKGQKHTAKKKKKKKKKRTTSVSSRGPLPPLALGPVKEEERGKSAEGQQEKVQIDYTDETYDGTTPGHRDFIYHEMQNGPSGGIVISKGSGHDGLVQVHNNDSPRYIAQRASPGGKLLRGSDHGMLKQRQPVTSVSQSSKHGAQMHHTALMYEPERSITPTDGATTRMESELESESGSPIELKPMTSIAGIYAPRNRVIMETSILDQSQCSSGIGSSVMTIDTQTNIVGPREGAVIEESDYEALTRKLGEQGLLDRGYDNSGFDERLEETV